MRKAELISRSLMVGVKVAETVLKLDANKAAHAAACLADDRAEQTRLREERHELTDIMLDRQSEQHHYLRLAMLQLE